MSMARILLLVPPGLPGTTPNHEGSSGLGAVEHGSGGFRYAPQTLAAVVATLRGAGFDVCVFDAPALGGDAVTWVERLHREQAEILAVQASWATSQGDASFLRHLRASGYATPMIAFGISTHWILPALDAADHILLGEPEIALPRLCQRVVADKRDLPRHVEAATLDPAHHTSDGLLRDLDALPLPAWDWITVERYNHLSILSSRGCTAGCAWCPYVTAQGAIYRACSPERTVAELRELVIRYRAHRILFRDPAIAHDRERLEQICGLILADKRLRPGKAFVWECESRPEHLDTNLLRLMSLAGCQAIKVGLETTGADVLAQQHRVSTPEETTAYLAQVADLARGCAEVGIACRLFVMTGLPGQTVTMARETAQFVRAVRPAELTIKRYKPYPGLQVPLNGLPAENEIVAQEAVLSEARQAIQQQKAPQPSRWQRAFRRAAYLVLARWLGGRR
jgi:anaerobic magnesium-protoporphyrin IX monomethyl ester cyclase